ncbi:MAG: alpha/beta hydrolase [Thermodesulfobacteriota bacterium]
MRLLNISFKNQDGIELSAMLDMPDDWNPLSYALFAHCFTCSKNLKALSYISRALVDKGIAVLRFDFTGLGESEGEFSDTNFSSNIGDLVSASEFLKSEYEPPQLLIGHSLGGAAVLQAAELITSVRAVVTIAAPSEPLHVARHFESSREEIETSGEAQVSIAGREFKIKKQFIDDLQKNSMLGKIRNLKKPLLILHSPLDEVVSIDNASDIFLAAKHPKSFVSLITADHLLTDSNDSQYAGDLIAVWAKRFLLKD